MKKWWILLMIAWQMVGFAHEGVDGLIKKKYHTAIVAFFKNEEPYLREWIEYHRLIGIDHFYLYDHQSSDCSFDVLQPYIHQGLVTLFSWVDHVPEYLMQQEGMEIFSSRLRAYEHAAKYAAVKEAEWLIVVDVDDFLVPVKDASIKQCLDEYEPCAAIRCPTLSFQAKHADGWRPCLLIESRELIEDDEVSIKEFFRPEEYTSFQWPSYEKKFKAGSCIKQADAAKLRVHKYRNRHRGALNFKMPRVQLEVDDQSEAVLRFVPELQKRLKR